MHINDLKKNDLVIFTEGPEKGEIGNIVSIYNGVIRVDIGRGIIGGKLPGQKKGYPNLYSIKKI